MLTMTEARELVDDLFEEEALLVGGLAAVRGMDDDLVWRLMRSLDAIRRKVLRRLGDTGPDDGGGMPSEQSNLKPHPAVEEFLIKMRRA